MNCELDAVVFRQAFAVLLGQGMACDAVLDDGKAILLIRDGEAVAGCSRAEFYALLAECDA